MTSVYWSIATTCSVGYGDIHAHLVSEKALAAFCMISGIVFFGYIIATITASLSNADSARAMYKSKVRLWSFIGFLGSQVIFKVKYPTMTLSGRKEK